MPELIDDPVGRRPTFAAALQQLRSAQKSSKGAAAYSRYVNRPLGRILAAAGASIGLTPNLITLISSIFTFTGIALIAILPPTPLSSAGVALALVLGYAFDSADGQVARLTGGGSLAGEWLDHMVDAFKTTTLHVAVLIGWFRFSGLETAWLAVPLAFSVVATVIFFGLILTDFIRRLHRGSSQMILKRDGTTSLIYSLAVLPFDYGLLCVLFLLFWWTPVFSVLYLLLLIANVVVVPIVTTRWFIELRRLGRS